jgi:hypothetical protein
MAEIERQADERMRAGIAERMAAEIARQERERLGSRGVTR